MGELSLEERKAYKGDGISYVIIYIDYDSAGNPLLPDNTTVESPPENKEGFYLTVKNSEWTYIEIPTNTETDYGTRQRDLLEEYAVWDKAVKNSPFLYQEYILRNDDESRINLNGATLSYQMTGRLPLRWFDAKGDIIDPVSEEFFLGLLSAAQDDMEAKYVLSSNTRGAILSLNSLEEINAYEFPIIHTVEQLEYVRDQEDLTEAKANAIARLKDKAKEKEEADK